MYTIYVDDIRIPTNKFDIICRTTNEAMNIIRKKYKEGVRHFYLDLDHDAGCNNNLQDINGGDFINILKHIETYVNYGKMKNLDIDVHFHSMNPVGVENMRTIVRHNNYMYEVY